jgi:hypothetical protein
MSAAIPQKKGWGGARFEDHLDAQDGNHPVFRIRAAIPFSVALLLQNH